MPTCSHTEMFSRSVCHEHDLSLVCEHIANQPSTQDKAEDDGNVIRSVLETGDMGRAPLLHMYCNL